MYSEKMEALIEATLADGKLTEKEKSALVRRAEEEGIDLTELEVYIDSILQKRNQAEVDNEAATERKAQHGELKKCPNCGAIITGMEAKCTSCGYEFRGLEANKSAQKLAEKLEAVEIGTGSDANFRMIDKKATIITAFPIPTTKEDLMEFLISMTAKEKVLGSYGYPDRPIKEAYRAKMGECITKARISFGNDPTMQQIIAEAQAALDVPLKNLGVLIAKIVGGLMAFALVGSLVTQCLGL